MKKVLLLIFVASLALPLSSNAARDMSKLSDLEVYDLLYHKSVPTRVAAIRTLGIRGYQKAIPDLVELCYDYNRQVRTASIQALGMMDSFEALDTYYFIIWDTSGSFTLWDKLSAVSSMGKYPDLNVVSLIDVMDLHKDFKVALFAAKALEKRPEAEAQEAIYYWKDLLKLVP